MIPAPFEYEVAESVEHRSSCSDRRMIRSSWPAGRACCR